MRVAILGSLLVLTACGPAGFGSGSDAGDAAQPAEVNEPATPANPADGFEADVAFIPTEEVVAQMIVPNGLTVTPNADGSVTISGDVEVGNAAGRTSGASFEIGPDQEAQLADKLVVVRLLAKGTEGATMHVAYSTNEVGNSGWKAFPLTGSFEEYSFEIGIAPMKNGNGDYLGIVPQGGDIVIAAAGLDILGERPAPAPVAQPAPTPAEDGTPE